MIFWIVNASSVLRPKHHLIVYRAPVFHCRESKLATRLKWNNVHSEVIYENAGEAMAVPVRPVNCGGAIVDGEFAGAPKKKRRKRRRQWKEEEEQDDRYDGRDGDEQKSLRFRSTTFSRLNVTVSWCQFQRLLDRSPSWLEKRSTRGLSPRPCVIFSLLPGFPF